MRWTLYFSDISISQGDTFEKGVVNLWRSLYCELSGE